MPFVFLRLLWRSRKNRKYRERWGERLGFCPHDLKQCIWVHAVSVGETLAALPLIKAIKKDFPTYPVVVTNMTVTGGERVKAAFGDKVLQAYIPYDLPDAVERFLKKINPAIAVVMETELWPNLFAACKKNNIPVVVANARLSEKSANGYQVIRKVTQIMFAAISKLAVQSPADAKRFIDLGMPKEKVEIVGNIKFDVELPDDLSSKSKKLRTELGENRLIWIAASTHPTEEEIVLAAHQKVLDHDPSALLILVPRHPERFDAVATLIQQTGFKIARRSAKDKCASDTQVYLADTMGELLLMYAVCDVAFVAGSFAPVGGHNMLEAAVLAKPIVMGPQLFNFAEASQMLLTASGMVIVKNANELANDIISLFSDEKTRKKRGENALKVLEANRGSLKKQMNLITQFIAMKL